MTDFGVEEAQDLLACFQEAGGITRSLPERMADKVAEDIIRGVYAPGQPLLEITLAESFDVSRGPVREALRILEREGLVTIQARRGASVKVLSPCDVRQIFSVRAVLYGLVASEIARQPGPEVLEDLHAGSHALDAALEEGGAERFLPLLYRLSMYLAKAGNNACAYSILFSQGRQTLSTTRRAMLKDANRRTWTRDWKRIVAAIEARDPVAAEKAARTLVENVYAATRVLLPPEDAAGGSSRPNTKR